MKKIKQPQLALPRFIRSRWFVVGVLVLAILGVIGAYIWWSQSSWAAYERKYIGLRRDIDSKLTAVFSLQSDTSQQRQEKTANLAKFISDIDAMGDSFCHQNALVGWQRAFSQYKTQEESCKGVVVATKALNDQLKIAVTYLQQEQALAKQLAATPSQTEVAEGEFEQQLTTWRGVYDGIKNANASSEFEPVKQAALGTIGGIVKSWEEIIAAHQAKDKARYIKAIQTLAAAYDGLQTISSISTPHLTEVAKRTKEAYDKLQ